MNIFSLGAFLFCLGFVGGVAVRSFFDVPQGAMGSACVCALLFGIAWIFHKKNYRALFFALVLFGVSIGLFRFEVSTWDEEIPYIQDHIEQVVVVEGVVAREVDERSASSRIAVKTETVDGSDIRIHILVVTDRFPRYAYGDRLTVYGVIEKPQSFETDLGRTFNYPGYLSAQGIEYMMTFPEVSKINEDEGIFIISWLLKFKQAFMKSVELLLPEPSAGLAEGLTLGVKRALGSDLEEMFRKTGIIHIVVLSGYNVAIVAEGIMRLLSVFLLPRARAIVGIIAIVGFAIIAGLSSTVVRASIMASLILYARATGNTYSTIRALIFAGMCMLVINPKLLIFDPGFQLSFLATLGLILLAPLIEKKLWRVPSTWQVREFLTATIATQIFVLPLLLFMIGEFSVVALLVNVLVLPAVPFAMLGTFLAGVLGLMWSTLALPFAFLTHGLLTYIVTVVAFFASLPFAAFAVPIFSFWYVVVAYIFLGIALYTLSVQEKKKQ